MPTFYIYINYAEFKICIKEITTHYAVLHK